MISLRRLVRRHGPPGRLTNARREEALITSPATKVPLTTEPAAFVGFPRSLAAMSIGRHMEQDRCKEEGPMD